MTVAITREIGESIMDCELTHREREPIDVARAREQHRAYRDTLRRLGATVVTLPVLPGHPDAVFVEDPAIVLDELSVITRTGALSRRGERDSLAEALRAWRPRQRRIAAPALLEGGDVFRVERRLFAGRSGRTDDAGIEQLRAIVAPFGYTVHPVDVHGCLHLKSACCPLEDGRVLANRTWLDPSALADLDVVDVPDSEPRAANVLPVGGCVIVPAAHPRTADLLRREGYETVVIDNGELLKAEAGLTCSSLVFEEAV